MRQNRTLFAGPWVGEFGWELFCWHGFIRRLAPRFDRVIVACRTGHDLLYKDFADDIIHFDPEREETDMWKNHTASHARSFHLHYTEGIPHLSIAYPENYAARWWVNEKWHDRQDLKPYETGIGDMPKYDVLLIVRQTAKCNTAFRNWPTEHAAKFVSEMRHAGFSVACVGKRDSAAWVQGTEDHRNLPLDKLASLMTNARVIVGPQCGPIHFGTLCLLPQVTWQTCAEHAKRTEENWNPFKVPVLTIPSADTYWRRRKLWFPSIKTIVSKTYRILIEGVS